MTVGGRAGVPAEQCEQEYQFRFSHSVVSDSLQPHGLQHARLPCSSPTPRACSNSCLSQGCHPPISGRRKAVTYLESGAKQGEASLNSQGRDCGFDLTSGGCQTGTVRLYFRSIVEKGP